MSEKIVIEEQVLDGAQVGPVTVNVDIEDSIGALSIEESLLNGEGTEINIELRDDLSIIGLDELVELKAELEQLRQDVETAVATVTPIIDEAQQVLDDLNTQIALIDALVVRAETAADEAETAKLAAEAAQLAAESFQTAAAASATLAKTSETNAKTSETNALASKNAAKTSETNAANSAASALASKNAAASSESAAATSASSASASKDAAKTSETNAANSAANALASKNAAKTSETNAATSEANALASKNAAKTSETNAKTSETNAKTSETNALAAEESSSQILADVTSKQADVTTKANAAAASAAAAKTSETNAKTSETKAKTSETNAAQSAASALASKQSIDATYTSFDTAYQDFSVKYPDVVTKHGQVVVLEQQAADSATEAENWAKQAENNANQTFVSGGLFTPTTSVQYPNITGIVRDTIWLINVSTFTWTTGTLTGKSAKTGDMLFYDTPSNTWTLLEVSVGVTSVDGDVGPNVDLSAKYLSKQAGGTVAGTTNYTGGLQVNGSEVYSPSNKPTAGEVGALPTSGGTMSAPIKTTSYYALVRDGTSDNQGVYMDVNRTIIGSIGSEGILFRPTGIKNGGVESKINPSGHVIELGQRVYSPNNKPTADDLSVMDATPTLLMDPDALILSGKSSITRLGSSYEGLEGDRSLLTMPNGLGGFQLAARSTGNEIHVRGAFSNSGEISPWSRIYTTAYKPTWADVGGEGYFTKDATGYIVPSSWVRAVSEDRGFLPSVRAQGSSAGSYIGNSNWWFKEAWVNSYRGGSINVSGTIVADARMQTSGGMTAINSGPCDQLILQRDNQSAHTGITFKTTDKQVYFGLTESGGFAYGTDTNLSTKGATIYSTSNKPTATDVGALPTGSQRLPAGTDLNTLETTGFYEIYNVSSNPYVNSPTGINFGTLQVIGRGRVTGSFVTQIITDKGSTAQWIRTRNDGTFGWTGWRRTYSEAYKPTPDAIGALSESASGDDWDKHTTGLNASAVNGPLGASLCIGETFPHSDSLDYNMQLASRNGRIFFRNKEKGVFGAWNQLYHTNNKPTWADVGGDSLWKPNSDRVEAQAKWIVAAPSKGVIPAANGDGLLGTTGTRWKEAWVNLYRGSALDIGGNALIGGNFRSKGSIYQQSEGRTWGMGITTSSSTNKGVVGLTLDNGVTYSDYIRFGANTREFIYHCTVNNLPEEYAIYHEGKKPTWADVGGTSFFTTDGTNIASTKPLYEQGNRVYSAANKPAATDIGAEPTLEADRKRKITYGTAEPTGGSDGDIYIQYEV